MMKTVCCVMSGSQNLPCHESQIYFDCVWNYWISIASSVGEGV